MGRRETFTVEASMPGRRLDQFLHERFPETSRGEIQRLITEGCVQVNGKVPKASQKPKSGDGIAIEWPDPVAADVVAQDIPLDLLFEDDDLLVLNQPPGLVVHPAAGHADGTLVNALLH
ncbi:MAG: S4 domain-containing protein, partial [Verrucomicrobiota bacterium]